MRFSVKHLVVLSLMLLSAMLAIVLHPTISLADDLNPIELKTMVPTSFGDWREEADSSAMIVDPQLRRKLNEIYNQTLSRTYTNSKGYRIMLSIAYGKNQSDGLQMHKPEICYPAQGFVVLNKQPGVLAFASNVVPVTRLMTKLNQRSEPVTYWTVVGDHVTKSGIDKKLTEIRYAFSNRIPDGMLVRVSSVDDSEVNAYDVQRQFATQMIAAIAPADRDRFSGKTSSLLANIQSP